MCAWTRVDRILVLVGFAVQVCRELSVVSTMESLASTASCAFSSIARTDSSADDARVRFECSWYDADANNDVRPNVKMMQNAAKTFDLAVLWIGLLICGCLTLCSGVHLYGEAYGSGPASSGAKFERQWSSGSEKTKQRYPARPSYMNV